MPIVLVFIIMHVKLTLLLWHNLLLLTIVWPLIITLVNALVCDSSNLAIWQTVKLLPINIFVGQLLDKRRDYGIDYGTIDLSAQFDLQVVVRKGELILMRVEASVPGSSYDLMDIRSWFLALLN
jgi:hypothetical protein